MPVKRRKSKRRYSVEAEIAAWSMYFVSGHDFFSHLEQFAIGRFDCDKQRERGEEFFVGILQGAG